MAYFKSFGIKNIAMIHRIEEIGNIIGMISLCIAGYLTYTKVRDHA